MGKETVKPTHPAALGFLVALAGTLYMCLVVSVVSGSLPDDKPKIEAPAAASSGPLPTWRTDVTPTTPDVVALATTPAPKPTVRKPTVTKKPTPKVTTKKPPPPSVYYKNCTAVRVAGADPLYRGEPGYRSGLDRDHDGVACED